MKTPDVFRYTKIDDDRQIDRQMIDLAISKYMKLLKAF